MCISLVLGGNEMAQQTFFEYMRDEDYENKFLGTLRLILQRNFELTKKFMSEKNAKLEMMYKLQKKKNEKGLYSRSESVTKHASEVKTVKKKGCWGRRGNKVAINLNDSAGGHHDDHHHHGEIEMAVVENEGDEDDNLLRVNEESEEEDEEAEGAEEKPEKPVSVEKLEENVKKKYLSMTIRILRFLQLLCEGHYKPLQNNLRE